MENKKVLLYWTEMLTDVYAGVYTRLNYYTDGTVEESKIPKGPIMIPNGIYPQPQTKCPTCGK